MNYRLRIHRGFTLVELLVVISIIALIIGVSMSNLLGARGRARDATRKQNMHELKNALRLYYNDYQTYPTANAAAPYIDGCGTNHITACPAGCTNEFSAGGTDCDTATLYMKRFPRDAAQTGYEFQYFNAASTDDFCLVMPLENPGDSEITASQARCASACVGHYTSGGVQYLTCAD